MYILVLLIYTVLVILFYSDFWHYLNSCVVIVIIITHKPVNCCETLHYFEKH